MQVDLEKIKETLFENPTVRRRIVHDYGLSREPTNPKDLASELLQQFEQTPVDRPLEQTLTNREVFRAAVKALASNSRPWSVFLKREGQLCNLLGGYDCVHVHDALARGALSLDKIKSCLPGQSSSGDARAILRWAQLLVDVDPYYVFVQDLGRAFRKRSAESSSESLSDDDLLLCIVGFLGYPPTRWAGARYLTASGAPLHREQQKLPGMGYTLASEFLRNLRWSGFKPDRHIQRLLNLWLPEGTSAFQGKVTQLTLLLGRKSRDLHTYLTYSLLGRSVAPDGVPLSHVDNLIWLLGAYVEKKGRESDREYLL